LPEGKFFNRHTRNWNKNTLMGEFDANSVHIWHSFHDLSTFPDSRSSQRATDVSSAIISHQRSTGLSHVMVMITHGLWEIFSNLVFPLFHVKFLDMDWLDVAIWGLSPQQKRET
jgi:hypothetical protein